jgi:hypothetical protein
MNQQMPDLIVTPLRDGLLAGADNDFHLLIQVRAPDGDGAVTGKLTCGSEEVFLTL